jgi:hypothetical protein
MRTHGPRDERAELAMPLDLAALLNCCNVRFAGYAPIRRSVSAQ